MRKLFLIMCLVLSIPSSAQKYFTKTGQTSFQGSVDTFEPVEAVSNSTTVLLDISTSEVAALVFVNSFQFEVALMQEHFNENYMNTKQFPKAYFEGVLQNFDFATLGEADSLLLEGTLNIKGVKKNISTWLSMSKIEEYIEVHGFIDLKAEDFGIEIPSIVRKKIAEVIRVELNYTLYEK